MRIKDEDFTRLQEAIRPVISAYPASLQTYLDNGKTERRWRWDVFHAACDRGLLNPYHLYAYMNDEHIDTALRRATGTR